MNKSHLLWAIAMQGCATFRAPMPSSTTIGDAAGSAISATTAGPLPELAILSWVGGVALFAGIALLAVSRGTRGWYPALSGIILVVGNAIVRRYFDWIALPVVIASAAITAVVAWQAIGKARRIRRTKKESTCLKIPPRGLTHSHS